MDGPVGHARGALAQLVARFHGMEEVRGSSPLSSTAKVLVKGHLILKDAWLTYATEGHFGVNGHRSASISRPLVIIRWPPQILQAALVPPALDACATGFGSRTQ